MYLLYGTGKANLLTARVKSDAAKNKTPMAASRSSVSPLKCTRYSESVKKPVA